jgi:hypothetical protein
MWQGWRRATRRAVTYEPTSGDRTRDDRAVTQLPELGTAIGCRDGFAALPPRRPLGDEHQAHDGKGHHPDTS